eukprot:645786-Pelagomonas_calceolata.AAC.3
MALPACRRCLWLCLPPGKEREGKEGKGLHSSERGGCSWLCLPPGKEGEGVVLMAVPAFEGSLASLFQLNLIFARAAMSVAFSCQ